MRFYCTLFLYFIITVFISLNVLSADCKKPVMPTNDEWQGWLSEIKKEALKEGISQNTIDAELSDVSPQKKIIMRDRCQPESTITLKEYLYYRIDKSRVIAGRNMMKKYKEELNHISAHFGIQPRFIIAILGMESFYGKNQGNIRTIEAVTTLAYDRRRSSFYKKQLIAALKIIDQGLVESDKLIGSWGGAVGMTQMIPTTFIESGYDWDGGGVDIWNSYEDAFASIANYLTSIDKNPWLFDAAWGREVLPPKNILDFYDSLKQNNPKGCSSVKSRSISKKLSEWNNIGFTDINKNDLPKRDDLEARLIAPDGINGRMFIVYQNYKNILYYNCSSYYAVSIGLLSDEIIK